MAKYYVYAHIRHDKGEPFYVGRGQVYQKSSGTRRAYETRRRNAQWKSIVERNGGVFLVEIVSWHDTLEQVLDAERQLIRAHGKQIDGTGTLINLTDGGDGSLGLRHSEETKAALSKKWKFDEARLRWLRSDEFKAMRRAKMAGRPSSMIGKKHKPEAIQKMSQARAGGKNINAKRIIDTATGNLFECVGDAAKAIGMGKWSLYKSLSGERKNHTSLRYE